MKPCLHPIRQNLAARSQKNCSAAHPLENGDRGPRMSRRNNTMLTIPDRAISSQSKNGNNGHRQRADQMLRLLQAAGPFGGWGGGVLWGCGWGGVGGGFWGVVVWVGRCPPPPSPPPAPHPPRHPDPPPPRVVPGRLRRRALDFFSPGPRWCRASSIGSPIFDER